MKKGTDREEVLTKVIEAQQQIINELNIKVQNLKEYIEQLHAQIEEIEQDDAHEFFSLDQRPNQRPNSM